MGGYYNGAFRELAHHNLTPVLSDPGQVESLERAAQKSDAGPYRCHVKVDTGMARLGTRRPEWPRLIAEMKKSGALIVEGLMTHLANADVAEPEALAAPLAEFEEARDLFRREGVLPKLSHMANSAALLRDHRTHYQMVRPGIALFGVDPAADLAGSLRHDPAPEGRFKPAMSVVSRIVSLRQLQAGDAVGYGGTFVARHPTLVATVPMGYADGLARAISGRGAVLVGGKRAPLVGTVSMDMTMIDVTDILGVTMRDEVVFLGHQKGRLGEDTITSQEMAKWCGSIPWEVLTNISRRVPRFYRES
jgi:alanine racemase